MVLEATYFSIPIFVLFGTSAIMFFKLLDSKPDKLNECVIRTYNYVREYQLDPVLTTILGTKKGKYKSQEILKTPEVQKDLDYYKEHLFKYNKVSGMIDSIMMMLKLILGTNVAILIIIVIFDVINELFINSKYNIFEINLVDTTVFCIIVLAIFILFFFIFIAIFMNINGSFKKQIKELTRGQ